MLNDFDQKEDGTKKSICKAVYRDFLQNTSFHAFKHAFGGDSKWCGKILWCLVIGIGTGCCSVGVLIFWLRFANHTVLILPNDEPSPIWSVPFPAVTVCLDGKQEADCPEQVGLLKQICAEACWDQKCSACELLFVETRTDRGICYTFNGLTFENLFRKERISPDLIPSNTSQLMDNWNQQGAFSEEVIGIRNYPRRAYDLSENYQLHMKFDFHGLNETCANSSSIQIQLHNPEDVPHKMVDSISLEAGQELELKVEPKVTLALSYFKYVPPEITKCFYGENRQLKYFTVYSESNCELECLTDYFLQKHSCVQNYMPHISGITICEGNKFLENQFQNEISTLARARNIPPSKFFSKTCNCLPACDEVQYRAAVLKESSSDIFSSQVVIGYGKDYFYGSRRFIRYGIVDFLADCGGLLSLFMGVSSITIVEMFYYCTLKPLLAR